MAELAVQNYITTDKVNVAGLVLAGSADFKNDLNQSDMFDNRLQSKVIKVVDVSYGGENGFNQAIDLASETLSNVKFIQEKRLINVRPKRSKFPNPLVFLFHTNYFVQYSSFHIDTLLTCKVMLIYHC